MVDIFHGNVQVPNTNTVFEDGYGSTGDSVGTFVNQTFSKGVISRSGVGQYDILFDQAFAGFLSFKASVVNSAARLGYETEVLWFNLSNAVDAQAHPARTLRFVFLTAGGNTPVELPNGAGFCVSVALKNSTTKPGA